MDNIILITQGSQAIHLVRKLFSLNYKPEQLKVLTILDKKNNCFINIKITKSVNKFLNFFRR